MSSASPRSLQKIYQDKLREHALALLWFGYKRLKPRDFAVSEEDDITGQLVHKMKAVIEDPRTPAWVEHYSVTEQVRVTTNGKAGKRRPIIDIEFERHRRGKRPRFPIEAKRLGRGSSSSDYVGVDGLGAFLNRVYDSTHGEVGMLGYVQSGSQTSWSRKISKKLIQSPKSYRLTPRGKWRIYACSTPPSHTYRTLHTDCDGRSLLVLHVLLLFS